MNEQHGTTNDPATGRATDAFHSLSNCRMPALPPMRQLRRLSFGIAVLAGCLTPPAFALDAIPSYEAIPLGSMIREAHPTAGISTARDVNEQGDAVGYAVIDNEYSAFIYTEAHGLALLPGLPGWLSHQAGSVSDRDELGLVLVAGTALPGMYSLPGSAVLWIYDTTAGSVVDTVEIGVLEGLATSAASAVNNAGLVVGHMRPALLYEPLQPMVYDAVSDTLHAVDLPFTPVDINDNNVVVGSSSRAQLVWDPGTETYVVTGLEDLGGPERTVQTTIADVNELGWVVGGTTMGYTDGNGRYVSGATRYIDAWEVLWALSAYDGASGLNNHGDVVGQLGVSGAIRPMLRIEATGQTVFVNDLIQPAGQVDGVLAINDAGWIAGGYASAVLLKRTGDLPVPTPPTGLTAVPHEPTWQQPWNAITLNWQDTSDLTKDFSVERRVSGTQDWIEIKASWINTSMWDTDVGLGVTYDYRVRARGIAGFSEYSGIATATAPATPVDTEDPVVTILTPSDGATVSGNVAISVVASDNVAVTYMDVTVSGPYYNSRLASAFDTTTLNTTWNTRGLDSGQYTVTGYASDEMNNGAYHSITVYVGSSNPMLRTTIDLSASTKGGTLAVNGKVAVRDEADAAVRSAMVTATWTRPDGTTEPHTSYSDRKGIASFSTTGAEGTYQLSLGGVIKAGYVFDAAGSETSDSIVVSSGGGGGGGKPRGKK